MTSNRPDDELDIDDGLVEPSLIRNWTQIAVRKSSRDNLMAIGKLPGMLLNRGGYLEPRPMNQVLEYLLTQAGKKLLHKDMGSSFEHVPSAFCACGPSWPPDTKYVVR